MTINHAYLLLGTILVVAFGYIFLFKHIPAVGWGYVYENWIFYVIGTIMGCSVFCIFYLASKLCEHLAEKLED